MKRLRGQQGVAAVEFAIISVFLIALFYGLISYGFIFGAQHDLTHAASEGARAALDAPAGQEVAYAEQVAHDALSGEARDHAVITADIVSPCDSSTPDARCIDVKISYDYKTYPVVPPLLSVAVPSQLQAESVLVLD